MSDIDDLLDELDGQHQRKHPQSCSSSSVGSSSNNNTDIAELLEITKSQHVSRTNSKVKSDDRDKKCDRVYLGGADSLMGRAARGKKK